MPALPPELLLEIFSRVCEPPGESLDSGEYAWTQSKSNINNPSPFLLGKICRSWRELAWSTPQLWTYIHLVLLPGNYGTQAQLLDDYLLRSKHFPLTVVVRIKERDEWHIQKSTQDVRPLYMAILRESSRWKSMDIDFPAGLYYLLRRLHISPSLRRMSINNKAEEGPPEIAFPPMKLQELSVNGISFHTSQTPQIYFAHLTYLRASSTSCEGLCVLFKNAPYLRWCSLDDVRPSWSYNPEIAKVSISMKYLESFIVRDSPPREVLKLLSRIRFSQRLREFRCSAMGLPTSMRQHLLNMIMECLGPSVRSLQILELGLEFASSITSIRFGLGYFLKLTRSLTTLILTVHQLTHLRWWDVAGIADLLDPVWPPETPSESPSFENRVLVPKLQHFELHMDNEGPSILPILTVLRHRWMFGSPAYADSASSKKTGPASTSKCAKIVSVRLPEMYRSGASAYLYDAIQEGMLIEFGGNEKLLELEEFLCE